jgi:hypothetical protein
MTGGALTGGEPITPTLPIATTGAPTRVHTVRPPAVGLGTARRLAELGSGPGPVLSVYLPFEPAQVRSTEAELAALAASRPPRESAAVIQLAFDALGSMPALAHGTAGLALFAFARRGELEVLPLPEPVGSMIVLDALPWLEPLAGMLCRGDAGAVVVGPTCSRLFRGHAGRLMEFAVVRDQPGRHAPSERVVGLGGAPSRAAEPVGRLAELMRRADGRRPFERLAVAAPVELWAQLEQALHDALSACAIEFTTAELHEAPAQRVGQVLSPILKGPAPTNGTPGPPVARYRRQGLDVPGGPAWRSHVPARQTREARCH